jgi:hypothetical protein
VQFENASGDRSRNCSQISERNFRSWNRGKASEKLYLAFDAGEVGRAGEDPVVAYTRPMIAKIVHDLANDPG